MVHTCSADFCIIVSHLVFLLKCAIQTYAWGKRGGNSEVARLMKNADNSFVIDGNTTYAEVVCCCVLMFDRNFFWLIFAEL